MEKKLPDTSHEAYKKMSNEILSNHHQLIVNALNVLKKATYEEIAAYLNWDDKNRAARRLSELERNQIIYKPGEKKTTKTGRNAYVYSLINKDPIPLTLF